MEQKLRVSEKLLSQIKTLEMRSEESVKTQAGIEPKLALIVKRTKELKSQVCILTLCYKVKTLFLKTQKTLIEFSNFECGLLTVIIIWYLIHNIIPSIKLGSFQLHCNLLPIEGFQLFDAVARVCMDLTYPLPILKGKQL